ncbi:aminopeptidase P family N-terminal domain-containing protein, partial [Phytopseudomonas straminea]
MTLGVGGSTPEQALARLQDMTAGAQPIGEAEYRARIARAQALMREQSIEALFVAAGSNLQYFTGVKWNPSERMVGAILPASGEVEYLAPAFEEGTVRDFQEVPGTINTWEEHESPYALLLRCLRRLGVTPNDGTPPQVGLCSSLPFFMFEGIRKLTSGYRFVDAGSVTALCRQRKSAAEIAL